MAVALDFLRFLFYRPKTRGDHCACVARHRFELTARVIAGALLATGIAPGATAEEAANDGAWTAMTIDQGSVRFTAHISGEPVDVRLGSASPSNSILESFVRAHGDTGQRADDDTPLDQQPPIVDLPLLISSRRIVLPAVYRVDGMAFDLHVGRDFFADAIVQIDYPNRRLRALDEDALALRKLANVPARRVDEQIGTHIRIDVQGEDVWAALATEYSGALMIPRALARQHGWIRGDDVELGQVIDSYGNEILSEGVDLESITIGPYRINDVRAVIMEDGESPLAGAYEQMTAIVGNDLLKYFQLSVDLDRAYVHIQTP
jgi:hypothetical protein